jgi:PAS domain S-box-containing protein
MKDYSERINEDASYVFPEPDGVADEKTLALAHQFLEHLAHGMFPDGQIDPELMTWAERFGENGSGARSSPQLSIEERLKAAEARFVTLVEQIPAVTFMAVLGEGENDVYVSPHVEQMLGYTQEEWLSDPFLWYYRLHPEDRALWNAEFTRGVRTGGPFRAECRFMARDGHTVWVHGEARLVKDDKGRPQFLQGVAFDITDSKRAQELVLASAVRDAKIEEELEIARRVQMSILPRDVALPGLEIAALMVPADDVGGDYYDVRPGQGGGVLTIGDVSGHGLDAGLIMLMMQSAASALCLAKPEASPAELLALLNNVIYENVAERLRRNEYVTLSVLRYQRDGRVTFAGAHQDILVMRKATKRCERIATPGAWIGIRDDIGSISRDHLLTLKDGDVLVLYTDGIIEAAKDGDELELFDVARLASAIEELPEGTPGQIVERIFSRVREFTARQDDDMTVLVARYTAA